MSIRQQHRQDELVAAEMRKRMWRPAALAGVIALHDAQILTIDSIQASIARADALLAHNAALLNQMENG